MVKEDYLLYDIDGVGGRGKSDKLKNIFMEIERPEFPVGINVFVVKDKKLLLGKRKNTFGAGTWGLPGGHLEVGEKLEDAATRELYEETGLKLKKLKFCNIVNDRFNLRKHYLQVGFLTLEFTGEPVISEPNKCEGWQWFNFDGLPENIFPPHKKQIELFLNKLNFSD